MDVGFVALAVGALLAAGIAASLLAGRLRLPGLVLVLVLGMVIGTDGLTLIDFHDYEVAQGAAVLALALILYEGGLSSGWEEIKPNIGQSIALATLGTLLTAGITAIAALWLFDELTGWEALMLGSTVAATDAAAVFAVLRGSTLRRKIARTLEGESGVNDPVAILLVIGCIEIIKHDAGALDVLWLAFSRARDRRGHRVGRRRARRDRAAPRHVARPPACTRSRRWRSRASPTAARPTAHGSGFLAVFLAGLVIGSGSSPARRTIITFHEGLAWVAQLALFLLLGLLVNPRELIEFIPEGTAIAIVTAVIARPLAALLVAYGFTVPERLLLGWAGLARRDPDRVRHLPRHRGHRARRDDLPGRVLRRAALHDPAGPDDRAGRALARRDLATRPRSRPRWSSP